MKHGCLPCTASAPLRPSSESPRPHMVASSPACGASGPGRASAEAAAPCFIGQVARGLVSRGGAGYALGRNPRPARGSPGGFDFLGPGFCLHLVSAQLCQNCSPAALARGGTRGLLRHALRRDWYSAIIVLHPLATFELEERESLGQNTVDRVSFSMGP